MQQITLDDSRGILYALVVVKERNLFGVRHALFERGENETRIECYDLGSSQQEFRLGGIFTQDDLFN